MKTLSLFTAATMFLTACSPSGSEQLNTDKTTHYTYVLVHGASGGGWDWRTMDDLLSAEGHRVYRPTLTGLGEKVHLASPNINLTTHIDDIANVILFEDLREVVLVGHSYGGMVITGVMDRMPERIGHAVFLDAAGPEDGMSAEDLWPRITSEHEVVDGQVHFSWLDTTAPLPRDVPQSLKTLTEPVSFDHPDALTIPVTFIAYIAPGQTREQRSEDVSWKVAAGRGWTIHTLESDHNAQRSNPQKLAAILVAAPLDRNRP